MSFEALLDAYLEQLLVWNRRINLTAIRDADSIREKHFADSLAVLPYLPSGPHRLVDVGSGGGFPGAVLALARPDAEVHLVEPSHKKAAFLKMLARALPLPNVTVHTVRAEDLEPCTFDVAISRATWDVLTWLDIGRRLIKPGGRVLAMEGAEEHALPPAATRHPYSLGGARRAIVVYVSN